MSLRGVCFVRARLDDQVGLRCEACLAAELERAGFRTVSRTQLGDCADPLFAVVEDPVRLAGVCAMEAIR